jgi:hypothetical protein
MFASLDRLIRRHATPGTMLGLLGFLVLFAPAFMILRMQLGATVPPDAMFGYSAEQAYAALAAEGEAGLRVHLLFEVIDLLLIPVYTALFATAVAYAARRMSRPWSRLLAWGTLVPVLAGLADYAEDGCLLTLISAYPERMPALAAVAGLLTLGRWLLVYASLGLAVVGLVGAAIQAQQPRSAMLSDHDDERPARSGARAA